MRQARPCTPDVIGYDIAMSRRNATEGYRSIIQVIFNVERMPGFTYSRILSPARGFLIFQKLL